MQRRAKKNKKKVYLVRGINIEKKNNFGYLSLVPNKGISGMNNILFKCQHGFRSGHPCETALHELISDLNVNRNKKLIKILLFIDFKKAFDLVDSKMLLRKLFHYGFEK